MSKSQYDPDGVRLPIKVDSTSNGEFFPRPLAKRNEVANKTALDTANNNAKKLGQNRRSFLTSMAGAASTLLTFNAINAAAGKAGGFYDIPKEAAFDNQLAMAKIGTNAGQDFIFDIQGHHVGNYESWRTGMKNKLTPAFKIFAPHSSCDYPNPNDKWGHVNCLTGEAFVKEIFLDSDTQMGVLTIGPLYDTEMCPSYSEAAATREAVAALDGTKRLLMHGRCMPTYGEIDQMEAVAEQYKVSAWKTYTQYGPNRQGYYLSDDLGQRFINKARDTGVNIICVHKGLPFPVMGKKSTHWSQATDIGPAAKANPDITFMVYHSGYDHDIHEGPYNPEKPSGVDILIKSMRDNGLQANGNVYAELGTTWRYMMQDPEQAAHVIGKLLKYVGEDRVVWGTDCIWYGSPQDQIQAFRTFQISKEYQEKYGYPEITPEIRAKIFGLNAAVPYGISPKEIELATQSDEVYLAKQNYLNNPDPSHQTYGPRTRREFLAFKALDDH